MHQVNQKQSHGSRHESYEFYNSQTYYLDYQSWGLTGMEIIYLMSVHRRTMPVQQYVTWITNIYQ